MNKQGSRARRSAKWDPSSCDTVEKMPSFLGKTTTEVTSEIGGPTRKETFKLAERQDEFRIELQNTYPLTKPENRNVQVQEWTWEEKDCNLTLWFHLVGEKWIVFETVKWKAGTEF